MPAFLTTSVSQHLHVQPDSNITAHNLVDLELQTGKSTNFTVALPIGQPRRFLISLIRQLISLFIIGQNFTFAYNTIADQFTVFVCEWKRLIILSYHC